MASDDELGFRGDPAELYWIDLDAAAELDGTEPVLLVALDGYVDAGSGVELAARHLHSELDLRQVVTFDADVLIDYRSRRPALRFESNAFIAYDAPTLAMYVAHDEAGTPLLLLTGPEPDLSWERFIAAITELVDHFSIRLVVSLLAIPMGVPHTRPAGMTAHATDPDLVPDAAHWTGSIEVPGHLAGLLEYRLGQSGRAAMGLAAHVPHYLARSDYPDAARNLIRAVAERAGLLLPTATLDAAAAAVRQRLDEQIAENGEIAEVVRALEEQYDAFVASHGPQLLTQSTPLPTADEIGAQFEAYLATQDRPEG